MDDQEEELPVLLGGKSHVEKDKIEASSLALFPSFYVFFCAAAVSLFSGCRAGGPRVLQFGTESASDLYTLE